MEETTNLNPLKDNVRILSKIILDAVNHINESENVILPLDKQNGLEIIIEDNIKSFINYGHKMEVS